jgi:hypothetical protein
MTTIVENKRQELARLCKRYQVRRLELFGSASKGDFDPASSDLDFLVEYQDLEPGEHATAYLGLMEALQNLFDRGVDLVEVKAIRNPFFLKSINQNRTTLYAA